MTEPCATCGIADALERHAGDCAYAINIGLPRLADGEDPIDPIAEELIDKEELMIEAAVDVNELDELTDMTVAAAAPARSPSLWIAYAIDGIGELQDAVVFESELTALRHAVAHGEKVHPLELGRSLREQTESEATGDA